MKQQKRNKINKWKNGFRQNMFVVMFSYNYDVMHIPKIETLDKIKVLKTATKQDTLNI